MDATKTIPIIFTSGVDPVASELVRSLNRPEGNATGVTMVNSELGPKKLEFLHEVAPRATKVAMFVNPNNSATLHDDMEGAQGAASRLGLEIIIINATTEGEIDSGFSSALLQGAGGILVGSDAFFTSRRTQIAALALRHGLPTISSQREGAVAGQLMSYGASATDMYRQAGIYVGRVLNGEKPGLLPVLQPSKFSLVINITTAKALGLAIPDKLLALADEVIE